MAHFAEITLNEMDTFLKRGWRALRPRQGKERGTHVYDLFVSPVVMIRVWTTIPVARETVRDVGETTIKIQLLAAKTGKPLTGRAKALIVKRVEGWRGNLQNRIEDLMEIYEEQDEYFDRLAGGVVRPQEAVEDDDPEAREREQEREAEPAPKPKDRYQRLREVMETERFNPAQESPVDYFVRMHEQAGWTKAQIDEALREEMDVSRDEQRAVEGPSSAPNRGPLPARFTKLQPSGEWGLRIEGDAAPGDKVRATRADGKVQVLTVGKVTWRGRDRATGQFITVAEISRTRTAGDEFSDDDMYSYDRG